ncbi:MAG TPA: hypothetical protein VFR78_05395 [Pyrinomonadaceae bacterium]|nr:hypothetical protein [Pyrinomonadaceae bacterium]
MEDLFRFLLARPAQQSDPNTRTVIARPSADYIRQLREARRSNDPLLQLKRIATAQAASPNALASINATHNAAPIRELLKTLGEGADRTLQEMNTLVRNLFNRSAQEVVSDPHFNSDRERVSDSLITNAILGRDGAVTSDEATRFLRALAIVEKTAGSDATLFRRGGLKDALSRLVLLPKDIFPVGAAAGITNTPTPEPGNQNPEKPLRAQREKLLSVYSTLTRVAPESFVAPDRPVITIERPIEPADRPVARPERPNDAVVREEARTPPDSAVEARTTGTPLRLKPEVVASLSETQKTVLAERGLELTRVSLPSAVERLSQELQAVDLQLAEIETQTHQHMVLAGNSYTVSKALDLGLLVPGRFFEESVPSTHGNLAPAGIGDLLVVKQNLKRYEARELAHVENILKGEFKERVHRRARTTEETFVVETEVEREEERDQQTTERFEMKSEVSQVQKEDMSLKVGLAVSGKYGPVVEFKASTDFALSTSKEEASKFATSYSKEITSRAASRIFERRREERILKTIEVFEEKNTHGVDNKEGNGHVIGQYQWLDKLYEAQVFNYGKRLLFDIMIPEPAVFLLFAMSGQPKAGADLIKPVPFSLKPTDISEWNYSFYVKQYEALGVEPPPQPYLAVSKAIEGMGKEDTGATKTLEIPLPTGYQAVGYEWKSRFNRWDGGTLEVVILPEPIDNRVGTITLAVKSHKVEAFIVSLGIHCQRTERLLDEWKLKTHAAILQAYQKQLRDYEEKLAALQVQAAQQIQGRNPLENEQLIRSELKKSAISVFTAQHFDLFGAISTSPQGYPQANLAEAAAEGKYVRFFEQAFEWEQMMYFFYPYFWGRKPNWLKRVLLQDTDPRFAEFMKAGFARVVLSVRPGFEHAVAHFLTTGETWNGGDLPDITSPLYLSIIEEIRERDDAPGAEIPQGDPWDVRLPTTLVKLRNDNSLPAWAKNAQGEWVPA